LISASVKEAIIVRRMDRSIGRDFRLRAALQSRMADEMYCTTISVVDFEFRPFVVIGAPCIYFFVQHILDECYRA